ncbi:MAG: VOC family protein [Planctomycetota bacterium]|jgi:catechol 2,3-dioxygenase-like lactoylglutathione lyase family enzyme
MGPISPFFIVADLERSLETYREQLGFEVRYTVPEEEPFFAMVGRGDAQILLKHVADDVGPLPNPSRHEWARWDAFVHVEDPDALAAEYQQRGAEFREPLEDHDDGLRGFAVADADGYVLFFGRPV